METSKTLRTFANQYFSERDLKPSTKVFYLSKLAVFDRWLGRPATLDDLNAETVNAFLEQQIDTQARETARGAKATLRAIWQAAFEAYLIDKPPLRVKRIRRDQADVDAWDRSQLSALLKAAASQLGTIRVVKVPRALFWLAVIRTLFETGLRCGDLRLLERDKLTSSGTYSIRQSKTGKLVRVAISDATFQAIERISSPDRRYIFGDVLCRRSFFEGFKKLAKQAGLQGGSKMLRRSSGSLVESEHRGEGHLHLGNGRAVFERHYLSERLAPAPVRIPSLLLPPSPN